MKKYMLSNKRISIAILLVICSQFIIIYQLNFSESSRIKKNLDDFSIVESFFSPTISQIDIKKIYRENKNYSFTIVNYKEADKFQELGKVYLFDKKGDLIGYFFLLKKDGEYLVYMRNIYMVMC